MNQNVGELIKEARTKNNMTLKDVAQETGLSIGYLSQLERGLTSIAHDTLKKVAKALDVEMTYFMEQPKIKEKVVLRSYEREILRIEGNSIIEYAMTNMADRGEMLPKLVEILPQKDIEESLTYPHEGEEFVYVLEGILTLQVEHELSDLYPGDSAHYKSTRPHNWSNQTNKVVKFITINTPNLFKESGEKI